MALTRRKCIQREGVAILLFLDRYNEGKKKKGRNVKDLYWMAILLRNHYKVAHNPESAQDGRRDE